MMTSSSSPGKGGKPAGDVAAVRKYVHKSMVRMYVCIHVRMYVCMLSLHFIHIRSIYIIMYN